MTTIWRPLAALALMIAAVVPATAAAQVGRSAAPAWVEAIEPPPAANPQVADGNSQSTVYLLVDTQIRVEPSGRRQQYRHLAMQPNDTAGVEGAANIEVDFDPSYQTLTLHRLRVHRAGEAQDRLRTAQVRLLQRERELEGLIYDGSRTASIFLRDVRIGDVIEYAYSIEGSNAVFGGRNAGVIELQWSSPVVQLRTRLLLPGNRPLTLKTSPAERSVQRRTLGAYTEYRLDADAVPGLRIDADAPGWHAPRAVLAWSEWASWGDVARWAVPLYTPPAALPLPLQAERNHILLTHTDPADRAAAALRWVQREIRYLGIEVGANSHAPTPPAAVIARRFGDCKDKTLLTVTLLRALGLQAEPALVHTELKQGVQDGLPRPTAFNHVIVRLRLDGKTYWLDPTRAPQPGRLDDLSQPDWGMALLVAPDTTSLEVMNAGDASLLRHEVHLLLDGSKGLSDPATLTVTTTLRGRSAETVRAQIAADGHDRVQKRYLNFYARSYAGLRVAAPLEVQDDLQNNRLRVVEHYELDRLLTLNAKRDQREVWLRVPEVRSLLSDPRVQERSAPLALEHPVELKHEFEVRLPEAWAIKAQVSEVTNPAFSLRREVVPVRQGDEVRGLRLIDNFRSTADHVDADAMPRYLRDLRKARDELSYRIHKGPGATPDDKRSAFNLPIALLGLALLAGSIQLARRIHRWDPAPADGAPAEGRQLTGLLWLMPLALLVALCHALVNLMRKGATAFESYRWAELTLPGGAHYHPMLGTLLIVELAVMMAALAGIGLSLYLIWQRRSSATRVFLWLTWGLMVWVLLDSWIMGSLLADAEVAAPAAPGITLWVALTAFSDYLLRGSRARNTFVHRHGSPAHAASQAIHAPG